MMIKTGWVKQRQRGAALVVSLIMLLLMTLVGVTAMQVTTVQEKMVSNSFDLNSAFQAAEAALKRGEDYVEKYNKGIEQSFFNSTCTAANGGRGLCRPTCNSIGMNPTGNEDLCFNKPDPQWRLVNWVDNMQTLEYGNDDDDATDPGVTKIDPLPGDSVARQPRYMIEEITPVSKNPGQEKDSRERWYRVTAQGYGRVQGDDGEPLSQVMLQSVSKRLFSE